MFLSEQDYRTVISSKAFDVLSQSSRENLAGAEDAAIEEIEGYLRPKYDCAAIFSAEGVMRNHKIVQVTADIALYHLVASVPQKMGYEIRKERYEKAIEWLEGVQAGKVNPDLPLATDEMTGETGIPLRWGSETRLKNVW